MVSYLGVVRTIMMADTSQFNLAMRNASDEFRASAQKMQHQARGLIGIGGALNLAITAPMLFATRAVARFGAEYESSMLKIKQVSEMGAASFRQFSKEQLVLSKQLKSRPSELAQTGYIAAQAQITDPKSLRAFQKAIAMAQTIAPGDAPSELVSQALAVNVNAFKKSGDEIMDVIAQMKFATDKGQFSWRQYAQTIGFVASSAAAINAGDRFRDMNLALAVMTNMGVKDATAATALRNIYKRIYEEGKRKNSELNKAAKAEGYRSIVDMYERGYTGDVTAMMQAMGQRGYGTMQEATRLGFGQREIAAALALMGAPGEKVREFSDAYDVATSSFAKKFDEAQDTTTKSMEALAAAMERLKISFFSTFGGSIAAIIDRFADFIEKIASLPEAAKKMMVFTAALAVFASVMTGLLGVVKSIMLFRTFRNLERGLAVAGPVAPLLGASSSLPAAMFGPKMLSIPHAGPFSSRRAIHPVTGALHNVMRMEHGPPRPPAMFPQPPGMFQPNLLSGGMMMSGIARSVMPNFTRMLTGGIGKLKGMNIMGVLKAVPAALATGGKSLLAGLLKVLPMLLKFAAIAILVAGVVRGIAKAFAALPLDWFRDHLSGTGEVATAVLAVIFEIVELLAKVVAPVIITVVGGLVDLSRLLYNIGASLGVVIVEFFMHVKHGFGRMFDWLRTTWVFRKVGLGMSDAEARDVENRRAREAEFMSRERKRLWGELGKSFVDVFGPDGLRATWMRNYLYGPDIGAEGGSSLRGVRAKSDWDPFAEIRGLLGTVVDDSGLGWLKEIGTSSGYTEARTAEGYEARIAGRDAIITLLQKLVDAEGTAEDDRGRMVDSLEHLDDIAFILSRSDLSPITIEGVTE